MKIIKETVMGNGRKRLIVEVDANDKLVALNDLMHYRLGHPIEDVVPAHVVADAHPVSWCPVEQRWVS